MAEQEVVYIKLVSGDELFAQLHGQEDGKILLSGVLIMEVISDSEEMTAKYLFMSRYSPYTLTDSMTINLDQVIHFSEVNPTIRNHYFKSLEYATKIADGRLLSGIADASAYLTLILDQETERVSKTLQDIFDSAKESVMTDLPTSPTKH